MDTRIGFRDVLMAGLAAATVGAVLLEEADAHAQVIRLDNPELLQRFERFIEGGDFNQFYEGEDPPPFNEAEPPPGLEEPIFVQIEVPPEPVDPIALRRPPVRGL